MSEHIYEVIPDAVSITRYSRGTVPQKVGAVRVYRCSPERVMLQIRGKKSFASVSLPYDIAKKVAEALQRESRWRVSK